MFFDGACEGVCHPLRRTEGEEEERGSFGDRKTTDDYHPPLRCRHFRLFCPLHRPLTVGVPTIATVGNSGLKSYCSLVLIGETYFEADQENFIMNMLANPKVHCVSGASCSVYSAQRRTMQTAKVTVKLKHETSFS